MSSRKASFVLAISVVAGMLSPWSGGAAGATSEQAGATACAGNLSVHSQPFLTNLVGSSSATDFYAAAEHQNLSPPAALTVTFAESCTQDPNDFAEPGRARYSTQNGSAVAPDDYVAWPSTLSDPMCIEAGQVPPHDPCPPGTVATEQVTLDLADDSDIEPAVESFSFKLAPVVGSPPLNASRPTEAAVHVIDNDGSARVSLEPTIDGGQTMEYVAPEQSGSYDIPVFWAGPTGPTGTVPFSIGAVPGFAEPTLGVDYNLLTPSPLPASAFTHGGGRVAFIRLRILNDNQSELDEAFSITLTGGNAVAGRDTTTVTIPDAGVDTQAPRTNFHHPKHKKKYSRNAYQLREMHIFYNDQGGAGIQRVQIAISRKKSNGKCQWWNGKRFQGGGCGGVPGTAWKRTKYDRFLDWFLYRVPAFKPTQGTNIRFYRAFARGFDLAGNVETQLQVGRNKNTFRIKRR